MSSGGITVLKDLIPVHCTLGTAQKWYTEHEASEYCHCMHESAKRWRLYWITKYLENGKEVSRATYARTNNWGRAKILHEWGVDVYDDPENPGLPQDKTTYGELVDGTTMHRK